MNKYRIWIIWLVLKNGFYIFLSCFLLEKTAILLALLVYVFIFIDLGFEFLRMVESLMWKIGR
jgi:hypothetical protein